MSSLVQDLAANATRKAPNPNPCLCHGRNRAADSSQQYGIARTGLVADCPLCLLVEDQLINACTTTTKSRQAEIVSDWARDHNELIMGSGRRIIGNSYLGHTLYAISIGSCDPY